ncbi:MAG: pyridoxamine 5'-phosphate oxidase family protein [Candidatus Heimdallarchaeota archaeon]|nr:pyridoxamine 5'-phosphate oxidase family protein [Candidatus Heimdallarchaeota archaeon]MCK4769631.1 pyridoxamine 5'-phosphate oxidase family protein [Candidatus Heimdallarchaeota archaeon]
MKIEGTEEVTKELMEKTYAAYLSTIDKNGFPYIRAVFNLRCKEKFPHPAKVISEYDEDPYTVYISTNTSSIKVNQIEKNGKVAIYFALPNDVKGVMLQGEAEVLDDIEFKKDIWMENWTVYYPQGYTDPDFTILKIKPKLLKGWFRGHLYYDFKDE